MADMRDKGRWFYSEVQAVEESKHQVNKSGLNADKNSVMMGLLEKKYTLQFTLQGQGKYWFVFFRKSKWHNAPVALEAMLQRSLTSQPPTTRL